MAFEDPMKNSEISAEQWEQLTVEARHYYDLVTEKQTIPSSSSYQHILGSLIPYLYLVLEYPEEKNPEYFKGAQEDIKYLKKYFALLDEFPEFREKEMAKGTDGGFPEVFNKFGRAKEIVDGYEKELRKDG